MDLATTLPKTSMTLAQARSKLSGLHFAKEALSEHEREVLYIAEGLLRLVDDLTALPDLRALIAKPGVSGVDLYTDGVEVVGTPGDSDASAGFAKGAFTMEAIRAVVGADLPVIDCR